MDRYIILYTTYTLVYILGHHRVQGIESLLVQVVS